MLHLSSSCSYYLCRQPTDMRRGFDSLSGLVITGLGMNVLCGAVFIFINRKRNQVKLLLWEEDGLAMYYKRLEKGTYELPVYSDQNSTVQMSAQELQLILQGISLRSIRRRKRYQHIAKTC